MPTKKLSRAAANSRRTAISDRRALSEFRKNTGNLLTGLHSSSLKTKVRKLDSTLQKISDESGKRDLEDREKLKAALRAKKKSR